MSCSCKCYHHDNEGDVAQKTPRIVPLPHSASSSRHSFASRLAAVPDKLSPLLTSSLPHLETSAEKAEDVDELIRRYFNKSPSEGKPPWLISSLRQSDIAPGRVVYASNEPDPLFKPFPDNIDEIMDKHFAECEFGGGAFASHSSRLPPIRRHHGIGRSVRR